MESTNASGRALSFSELVFSDLRRYRPDPSPRWWRVALLSLTTPGMVASVLLRAQQVLHRSGHAKSARLLRSVASLLVGADFNPGPTIGTGLMLAHPSGVTIGFDLTIGDNVTFAGGVTCAARYPDFRPQRYATIGDGAVIGAHAVLIGDVRVGANAFVGANAVVMKDVPDGMVAFGNPARVIGPREDPAPGVELVPERLLPTSDPSRPRTI